MNRPQHLTLLLLLATGLLCHVLAPVAQSQPFTNTWVGLGTPNDNWDVPENWMYDANGETGAGVPDEEFNEHAVIDGGATVNVTNEPANGDNPPVQPGSVFVNGGSTLNIQSGGLLTVVNNGVTFGDFQVNDGTATVFAGGQVIAENVNTGSAGTLALEGTAQVTSTETAFLDGLTRITGPNATFNVRAMTLASTNRWEPVITGATHSIVNSAGNVNLSGTLRPNIQTGTPSVGDKWVLWDAANVLGDFTSVDTSLTPLGPAQTYAIHKQTSGSTNGMLGILAVEQLLTATVDRSTGSVTLRNVGTTGVSIDQYTISSASNAIDPDAFTSSLADDGFDGNSWQEANPTTAGVSELNAQSFSTIAGSSSNFIGNVYDRFAGVTEFGQAVPEDLEFLYRREDGRIATGIVEYVGDGTINNVLLTVDPETGDAEFKNDSGYSIEIDHYTISSESNSLLTSWDSLFKQSSGTWTEANPTSGALSELNPQGSTTLDPDESFTLAGLFNTATGLEDLAVQFRVPALGVFEGEVRYASLNTVDLPGDYNDDGTVNIADYTVWRNNLGASITLPNDTTSGSVTTEDYDVWKSHFGESLGAAIGLSAAVPEPATSLYLVLASVASLAFHRHRR